MQDWHATFLGRRRLPRELSGFELEAFFTFAGAERQAIVDRRQPALKLGLALLRVLNRGESVNALKRAIYTGRVAAFQAKRPDELAAVGDALGLLANLVMAWNTAQMQSAFDRLNARRTTAVPPELIGRIAPARTEGINLRGVFRFPVEAYADRLLPTAPQKTAAARA